MIGPGFPFHGALCPECAAHFSGHDARRCLRGTEGECRGANGAFCRARIQRSTRCRWPRRADRRAFESRPVAGGAGPWDAEERVSVRGRKWCSYEVGRGSGFHVTSLARATVGEIMTPLSITLLETAALPQAIALIAIKGVHRIAVVRSDGKVVGIFSAVVAMCWLASRRAILYVSSPNSDAAEFPPGEQRRRAAAASTEPGPDLLFLGFVARSYLPSV